MTGEPPLSPPSGESDATTIEGPAEGSRRTPPPMAYIRLYADADGHSRFEDVTLTGETRGVVESDLLATFSAPFAAKEVMFRYVVREADGRRRHNAPCRQFIVQLTGECEIEASDGQRRRMVPGTVLLVEDTEGLGHVTRRIGDEERMTLIIPLDG